MATADQIERIVLELEEQGAGKAYVGIKRLDDTLKELQKREGPAGVAEAFVALDAALSNSLVELPNMAVLVQQNERAFAALVAQIRKYNNAQVNKAMRNVDFELAREDAKQAAAEWRAGQRIPTELQQAPPSIDWAAALARESEKAGSAIKAASHAALEEAVAIGKSAQEAQKLASVYSLIENRAKAAAAADKRATDARIKAANRVPTELQQGPIKLTGGQKFIQFIGRAFGPKAVEGVTSTVEGLEKIAPIASAALPVVATGVGAVAVAAVAATAALTAATVGAGKFAADTAISFGKAVVQAQAYKEDVLEAFKIVRRTQGDADAILRLSSETSDKLGIDRAAGAGQFLDLLSKGFSPEKTKQIVASLADLSTVDPSARIDDLARIIGKIKAMNKLSQDSITELSTAGLEAGDVYGALEKRLGKSRAEVLKMISADKIDASGIDQVLEAIGSQVPEGAAAEKANRNLSSLLKRFEDTPKNILFDTEAGEGIGRIKELLRGTLGVFDATSDRGKEVRKATGDLFDELIKGFGFTSDTAQGQKEQIFAGMTFDKALKAANDLKPVANLIGQGFATAAYAVLGLVDAGSDFVFWAKDTAKWFDKLGVKPLEFAKNFASIAMALTTPGLATGAGEMFAWLWEELQNAGAQMYNKALGLGSYLWQGVTQGIAGGIEFVRQGATSLANAALGAVGSTWKVGSPAKAFEELSLWGGAGAERGFYKSASGVEAAAGYMAQAAIGGAAMTPANGNGLAVATAGQTGIVLNFSPTIVVQGASSPVQAQAVGAAAVRGARAEWEAQLGGTLRRLRYG